MNKYLILIIILLTSCSSAKPRNDVNFSNNMSLDEFKLKLKEYSKNNPYPNINN